MSPAEISSMNASRSTMPMAWMRFSYFGGMGLRNISSMSMKKNLHDLPAQRVVVGTQLYIVIIRYCLSFHCDTVYISGVGGFQVLKKVFPI